MFNICITEMELIFFSPFLTVRDTLMADPLDSDSQLAITSRSTAEFSRSDSVVC